MLSLENPPWVLVNQIPSEHAGLPWGQMVLEGNQPRIEWDSQDKSLRPVLGAVRENISMHLGLFLGLNFPSMLFSKLLAFTYPTGCLSGVVPCPKKYRLILPL